MASASQTTTTIFVLKHYDADIDNMKVFTNVDCALDALREWLECDPDLMNYALSKYECAPNDTEYEHMDDYDLSDLIDVNETNSDVSYITDSDGADS